MKCKFCGADLDPKAQQCNYCGSYTDIEGANTQQNNQQNNQQRGPYNNGNYSKNSQQFYRQGVEDFVRGVTGANSSMLQNRARAQKVVLVFALIMFFMIGSFVVFMFSSVGSMQKSLMNSVFDSMKQESSSQNQSQGQSSSAKTQEEEEKRLPQNKDNLFGEILWCDKLGNATVRYENQWFENVAILDADLFTWLNENEKDIDGIQIFFSTNGAGDIDEIGFLSSDFSVIGKQDDYYIACRDFGLIKFKSNKELSYNHMYEGYFSYPKMELKHVNDSQEMNVSKMDLKCEEKMEETEKLTYEKESVKVYKVKVLGSWYYCSEDFYNSIKEGDLLGEYNVCDYPACIVKE